MHAQNRISERGWDKERKKTIEVQKRNLIEKRACAHEERQGNNNNNGLLVVVEANGIMVGYIPA